VPGRLLMTAEDCAELAAMWAAKADQWDAELAAEFAASRAARCAREVAKDV